MRRSLLIAVAVVGLFPAASTARAQAKFPPETRNAALRYWIAFADLQDPPADQATQEALEKTASGEIPWDEAKLGGILDRNETAILEMQRATKLPECDWGLEYSQGSRTSIAYVPRARVLARLNTLYGMRRMTKGDTQGAIDAWLDGISFSQHLARGGTLIFTLVAQMSLISNLQALTEAAAAGRLDKAQAREVAQAIKSLPPDGFDWGRALDLEEAVLDDTARRTQKAPDPAAFYREIMGAPAPPGFAAPGPDDLAACHSLFAAAEAALRLPSARVREPLAQLQARVRRLHPFFQNTVPSFVKINEARASVEAARAKLLGALSTI
jgi:hypothetical protein